MLWPWTSRKKTDERLAAERNFFRETQARYQEREKFLREMFDRSEKERTDLQLKLLRAGFGINPFAEMFVPENQTSEPTEAPAPDRFTVSATMSEDDRRTVWVREAQATYGDNLRLIQAHVEKRQDEYYANRHRQPIIPVEDLLAAQRVAAELEADIAEGAASVGKVH